MQRATSGHDEKWGELRRQYAVSQILVRCRPVQTGLRSITFLLQGEKSSYCQMQSLVLERCTMLKDLLTELGLLRTTLPWPQGNIFPSCDKLNECASFAAYWQHDQRCQRNSRKTRGKKTIQKRRGEKRQYKTPLWCGFCQPSTYESCYMCRMSVKDNRQILWTKYKGISIREREQRWGGGERLSQSFLFTRLNPD